MNYVAEKNLEDLLSKIKKNVLEVCDTFFVIDDDDVTLSDLHSLSGLLGFYKKKIDYFIDEFF